MNLKQVLKTMVQHDASDLYLRTKAIPKARIDGEVKNLGEEVILKSDMEKVTNMLLATDDRRMKFRENLDIDFVHEDPDCGRFRVNIFTQRGTPAIVMRYVKSDIQSFEELNLPIEILKLFCEETRGIFLVCGPAGNGKSTTIASMIEYINTISSKHIVTIEDPIEFLFKDKKSIINQRELEIDVTSYPSALKHVTQQSPDIIYIGNIRDRDTMQAAVTATELGTFVITTLHTVNAIQTLMRVINFFPPHMHDEIRNQLSVILRGTLSLRLLKRKDDQGRIPAYETMVVTPTIARLIRENKINEIQKYIDEGELFGMQSFKSCMVKHVKAGLVTEEEARQYADSKDDFNLALKGLKRYTD